MDALIVKSKIKEWAKGKNVRVGEDFLEALNTHLGSELEASVKRAEGNGRRTLKAYDV